MAQDDMHVVMYKILAYLYRCMKDDKAPEWARCMPDHLGIPAGYWKRIMRELVGRGYIAGVKCLASDDGFSIYPVAPEVTMAGVEFLMENSLMRRAFEFLRDTRSAVPFV